MQEKNKAYKREKDALIVFFHTLKNILSGLHFLIGPIDTLEKTTAAQNQLLIPHGYLAFDFNLDKLEFISHSYPKLYHHIMALRKEIQIIHDLLKFCSETKIAEYAASAQAKNIETALLVVNLIENINDYAYEHYYTNDMIDDDLETTMNFIIMIKDMNEIQVEEEINSIADVNQRKAKRAQLQCAKNDIRNLRLIIKEKKNFIAKIKSKFVRREPRRKRHNTPRVD